MTDSESEVFGQHDSPVSSQKVASQRAAKSRMLVKSVMDIVVALLALPIVLPIIAVLCWLVRRDGSPGFFGHARVGRGGKMFKVWKIRTMVCDSDRVLTEHLRDNPLAAKEWEEGFKLTNDPRVTPFGRFLRETSLDELPQVWNVLMGEMSFVGPRPIVEKELQKYEGREWVYLSMKPGITGLWQVSGRNDVDYRTRVELDTAYATRWSVLLDIMILIQTVGVVIRRTGR